MSDISITARNLFALSHFNTLHIVDTKLAATHLKCPKTRVITGAIDNGDGTYTAIIEKLDRTGDDFIISTIDEMKQHKFVLINRSNSLAFVQERDRHTDKIINVFEITPKENCETLFLHGII